MKPIALSLAGLVLLALGFIVVERGPSSGQQASVVPSETRETQTGQLVSEAIGPELTEPIRLPVSTAGDLQPCSACDSKQATINALYADIEALERRIDVLQRDRVFYQSVVGESLAVEFREGIGRQFDPEDQDLIISYLIGPLGEIPLDWQLAEFLVAWREKQDELQRGVRGEALANWEETLARIFGPEAQRRIYE